MSCVRQTTKHVPHIFGGVFSNWIWWSECNIINKREGKHRSTETPSVYSLLNAHTGSLSMLEAIVISRFALIVRSEIELMLLNQTLRVFYKSQSWTNGHTSYRVSEYEKYPYETMRNVYLVHQFVEANRTNCAFHFAVAILYVNSYFIVLCLTGRS